MSRPESVWRSSKGVVYVEFLLVFPPLLVLFLVILQSAILRTTDLGVRHAASGAVRSAIVVLPDDPVAYEGAEPNRIPRDGRCSEGFVGKLHKFLGVAGVDSRALPEDGKCPGGPRMAAIHFAAIMRMLPFSPNPRGIAPEHFRGLLGDLGVAGWLAAAAAYSYGATAVTFPSSPGSELFQTANVFRPGQDVTVRVSYLAHCGIPIARFLMCDSSLSLMTGVDGDFFRRDTTGRRNVHERIQDSQPALRNLTEGVASRSLFLGLMLSGKRFRILQAEASLPLNSAPYEYKKKD